MKTLLSLLLLLSVHLANGEDKDSRSLTLGPCKFLKTDTHLWIHCSYPPDKKLSNQYCTIQLSGIVTDFVPMVYYKKKDQEAQRERNQKVAGFIEKTLKGKEIWIDVENPHIYAGPGQFGGVVWLSKERKKSLQSLLIRKGLAKPKKENLFNPTKPKAKTSPQKETL